MEMPQLAALIFAFFALHTSADVTSSSDALPILTLPYARVQAKFYDATNDVQLSLRIAVPY